MESIKKLEEKWKINQQFIEKTRAKQEILTGTKSNELLEILVFRAEMLLRLGKVDQVKETIRRAAALKSKVPTSFKFFGMLPEAYLCAVDAQIELAIGRNSILNGWFTLDDEYDEDDY